MMLRKRLETTGEVCNPVGCGIGETTVFERARVGYVSKFVVAYFRNCCAVGL